MDGELGAECGMGKGEEERGCDVSLQSDNCRYLDNRQI